MNKKIVSTAVVVGLLALIIAPLCLLYFDREMFFPYITGKNFFWRFFVEIAVVSWIAAALFSRQYRITLKNPFFLSATLFMFVVLISNMLGHDPYQSFWSNAERMDGYVSLLHLYGYFIALIGFMKERKHIEWMMLYLIAIGAIVSVIGWGQEKERIDSLLGNPIYLGSLSLFGIFLSGYFLVIKEKFLGFSETFRKVFYTALAILFLYTLFRTGTRGALLGLIGGGTITALLFAAGRAGHVDKWLRYLGGAAAALIIITGALFFGAREQLAQVSFIENNYLLSRVVTTTADETTTGTRIANWEMAIEGFKERPILGWGQENYTPVFSKYYDLEALWFAEQWYDRTHNTFMDWLVFGGIIGLLSYILLFAAILYMVWKAKVTYMQKSVLTGLFIGYLFQNIVAFDSLVSGIFLYACFALVMILQDYDVEKSEDNSYSGAKYVGLGVLVIATLLWMNHSIVEPRQSSKAYIDYVIATAGPATPERVGKTLPVFEEIFANDTFFSRELAGFATLRKDTFFVSGVPKPVFDAHTNLLLAEHEKSLGRYNSPTKTRLILGSFYNDLAGLNNQGSDKSFIDLAEEHLSVANKQSPDKARIAWALANVYEKQGKIDQSKRLIKGIAEAAPEYEQAQALYRGFETKYPE